MTDRRDFLRVLGLTAAAGALAPRSARALGDGLLSDTSAKLKRVGVQLYSVRDAMARDGVDRTLGRVAEIGFREVEFAGYYRQTAAQVRESLRSHGLTSPSVHVSLDDLKAPTFPKFVEDAQNIGHKWINLAWLLPNQRGSAEKYNAHADVLLAAQRIAQPAGINIGYHNHDFEFEPLGDTTGYEILLNRTAGSGVVFEMDLYWMHFAGQDPVSWWARYPGRFPMVHVKDSTAAPGKEMRPVGQGVIPFGALFEQRRVADIKHFYVEHDNPADPFASITSSFGYLKALRFR
ncbi:MAG: sugar phosphate isomerase/epimerase [Gemmatimonadaceae bacterium]|nr:sugar phosphate isomerase/epimerase [Gemmatimonadaceae bacterium]